MTLNGLQEKNFQTARFVVLCHVYARSLRKTVGVPLTPFKGFLGAVLWNTVSNHYTGHFSDFYRNVKKDLYFKELDFNALSSQSLPRHFQDYKCF